MAEFVAPWPNRKGYFKGCFKTCPALQIHFQVGPKQFGLSLNYEKFGCQIQLEPNGGSPVRFPFTPTKKGGPVLKSTNPSLGFPLEFVEARPILLRPTQAPMCLVGRNLSRPTPASSTGARYGVIAIPFGFSVRYIKQT